MPKVLAPHARKFGVEIECGGIHIAQAREALSAANGFSRGWSFGQDGSGVEARTPVLQGIRGFGELKRAYQTLGKLGAYVTRADGAHVHHDVPEFNRYGDETLANLVESWAEHRHLIQMMVAKGRHKSSMCPPWTPYEIHGIRKGMGYYGGYKDLTPKMNDHGTLEVRMHEGCLDYQDMSAWIRFCQRYIHAALVDNLPRGLKSTDELFAHLRLGVRSCNTLRAKIEAVKQQPTPSWYDNGRRLSGEDIAKGAKAVYR